MTQPRRTSLLDVWQGEFSQEDYTEAHLASIAQNYILIHKFDSTIGLA